MGTHFPPANQESSPFREVFFFFSFFCREAVFEVLISKMATAAPAVTQITTLDQLVQLINEAKADKLLVIDFYASWCMPCKQIGGEIDRLSTTAPYNDANKIGFYKCDVEMVEDVQEQYSISSIPYIILMKNKTKVGEMCGPNKEKLKSLITSKMT